MPPIKPISPASQSVLYKHTYYFEDSFHDIKKNQGGICEPNVSLSINLLSLTFF